MTSIPSTDKTFIMAGARGVVERTNEAVQIRTQVEAIEAAVYVRPAEVFDLARALVETICKTILDERGVRDDGKSNVPNLLKATLSQLQLFPDGHESPTEVTGSLKTIVNGLITTIHGLCDLRSREGMASHGQIAYSVNLEPVQALLAASAADTVVNFLWSVHRSYSPIGKPEQTSYRDNPDFNDRVDQLYEPPVMIFELPYKHSEILFHLDFEAYSDALQDHRANPAPSEDVKD